MAMWTIRLNTESFGASSARLGLLTKSTRILIMIATRGRWRLLSNLVSGVAANPVT